MAEGWQSICMNVEVKDLTTSLYPRHSQQSVSLENSNEVVHSRKIEEQKREIESNVDNDTWKYIVCLTTVIHEASETDSLDSAKPLSFQARYTTKTILVTDNHF